jgi:hypothetical protein
LPTTSWFQKRITRKPCPSSHFVRRINLDDQPRSKTNEIDDITAEAILTAKAQVTDALAAELMPEQRLGRRRVLA